MAGCGVVLLACWCVAVLARGALLGDEPQGQELLKWALLQRDDEDASSSSEELQPEGGVWKRGGRKGPTLSVVSPLEVLRQRLRLDRARERIRENQKQIVANEELLEKIGKRSERLLTHERLWRAH